jgi:hypothetical protein
MVTVHSGQQGQPRHTEPVHGLSMEWRCTSVYMHLCELAINNAVAALAAVYIFVFSACAAACVVRDGVQAEG